MTDSDRGRTGAREFDLILFGATGFTGRLVAEYLVKKRPSLRWALAGRSFGRLERVRNELATLEPSAKELPLLVGNSMDRAAMDRLVRRTRVLCTTAGPYARYGSALLGACAEQGTDYCDLTGETHWVREMIDTHHARAVETGARIVPSCGFDSIPSDLGVLMLHEALVARGGRLAEAHYRVLRMKGAASGGTIASALHAAERMGDPSVRRVLADPYALNPEGARSGPGPEDSFRPRKDPETGRWLAPFFMAPVNTRVVRRSNALLDQAYGHEFRYDETVDVGAGFTGLARAAMTSAGMVMSGAVAFAPVRMLAARLLPAPGEGPSREEREGGWFDIELLGVGTAGERVRARVGAKQDPGYGATSWMLGESALCLAQDELPRRGGLLTPASCMGMKLVERLRAIGMTFQVESAPQ
ncbi:saccharopine dehydrogenase family protein [Archangium lansingense]|uniref:Saccharopine dehydrogenase NADP-binding domain-containing protein n=1 Tax=Archangium lansingense TaxID=2995310 RepID=A0ABT4AQ22_9BACT|nr:saccharopine dehydrogenase NADP-binding domain-containing protein [Archangium lansinium]MCY1083254.1 saccharopine dehydrogenase NADP-binding domain-containing protein [Archangium lansinium]